MNIQMLKANMHQTNSTILKQFKAMEDDQEKALGG
jgi:hypothetical protein